MEWISDCFPTKFSCSPIRPKPCPGNQQFSLCLPALSLLSIFFLNHLPSQPLLEEEICPDININICWLGVFVISRYSQKQFSAHQSPCSHSLPQVLKSVQARPSLSNVSIWDWPATYRGPEFQVANVQVSAYLMLQCNLLMPELLAVGRQSHMVGKYLVRATLLLVSKKGSKQTFPINYYALAHPAQS